MAGKKPEPTAVKKLEGNPRKRKLNKNEPVPAKGICWIRKTIQRFIPSEGELDRHFSWQQC